MRSKSRALILILFLFSIIGQAQKKTRTVKDRPNIVIFIADDLGYSDIGPYGNKVVRTPSLDQLAGKSTVFNAAFASSPTCSPSRASIHTGLMPFRNGAHANHTGINNGIKTLPTYLKEEGYKVGLAGKLHIGPMEQYPFDLIAGTNVPEPGKRGVLWTDLTLDPVDKWLENTTKSKDPFVLVVNDHSPHVLWPEEPEYTAAEVDIPSFHIDTEETRKARAKYYTDITKMDRNVGKMMEILKKNGLEDNTIFIFTADQGPQWAFGKWNLYDYGIQVPLIMHWPGKNTPKESDELISLTDILPTIIEIAGGEAPGSIDGKSFLGLLNGTTSSREVVYGSHTGDIHMNRTPMRMIRTKRYKYILNVAPEQEYHTHMDLAKDHDGGREYWESWRIQSFKDPSASAVLWRYHNRPKEELYDISKDPHEKINLAANPHYQELLNEFQVKMKEWRKEQGDSQAGPYQAQENNNNSKGPVTPYIFE